MASLPTDICNQALDAAGVDFTLGDIEEGTRPAQVCLRAYWTCLRQLLRGAPWDFARREVPLLLLADATGQTPNVGTTVGSGFVYCYAYPNDCARVRYIPWIPFDNPGAPANNIQPPNAQAPLLTNMGQAPLVGHRIVPARFLITNDPNFPPPAGSTYWDVQGVSPQGRIVILTNVVNAKCVYTMVVLYPSVWDHLFRSAMVAYLASEISLPLAKDKKFGLSMREQNIAIVKEKIVQARIADGNEGWTSTDHTPDWIRNRNTGGSGGFGPGWAGFDGGGGGSYGCFGSGWGGSLGFGNGSTY